MAVITTSGLDINPEEVKDIAKAVFELNYVEASSPMADLHSIETGIKYKTQILFAGLMGLVGKKTDGDCSLPAETSASTLTEKFWDPIEAGFRLTYCAASDLDKDFKAFQRKARALDWYDETGDQVMQFLTDKCMEALKLAQFRLAWFGDTAAADITGGGVLTNGTDEDYFNALDGLWKQIYAAIGADKVAISENGEASYAAQMALASDKALTTMRAMYEAADPRLITQPGLKFMVTKSLANNFQTYIEDQSTDFTVEILQNGQREYSYRGIPVVIMYEWDRIIKAYYDNGTTYFLPHRALLTVPENIPIGTLDTDSLSNLDIFYDKVTKKNYIDSTFKMDAKFLENYMAVVAY